MRSAEMHPSTRPNTRIRTRRPRPRTSSGHDPLDTVSLNGDCIRDSSGVELGRIEGVILDGGRDRIAYAVLSFGAWAGVSARLFAVPWSALSVNAEDACVVLEVPKKRLKAAPSFARDSWPSITDPGWCEEIDAYYRVHHPHG
jgi:PRC-barrel domain